MSNLAPKYLTSIPLIADIRSLDYTSQASVVKAFVEMLDEIDNASENYLVDRFLEDCEDIDFDNPSDSLHPLHLAVNDMDNRADAFNESRFIRFRPHSRLNDLLQK